MGIRNKLERRTLERGKSKRDCNKNSKNGIKIQRRTS
jgi:hypothetical protein